MKKNREYWAERLRIQEEARNRKNGEFLKELEKAFTIERNNIAGQIEAWYGRLAQNNSVSMAEARKMLSRSELQEFKWTLEEYIKYGQENAIDGRWMKQLENASAKSHISRLEALELELRHKVEKLYGEYGVSLETHLTSQLKGAYKDGMSLAGIDATFNAEKAKTVLSKPWTTDGRTFSDRVWKQKAEMVDFLHTEMTRMAITGETPKRLTEELKNKFGVSLSSAKRLVNTETAYLASVANKQMFEDLDVEYYEILAEIDGKTSDICRSLDGQVFEMKIFEEGVTAPPFHVSCRSITAPWFPDEEERIEKNSKRGYNKTSGGVSGAITDTYSEAAKKHAKIRYNAIRKQKHDVRKIATNTGYTEEIIQEIKDYLFIDEHNLGDRIARFDPDFAIAHSWDRLSQGVFEPQDLTLLKHEIMERQLIREGLTQHEAHIQTSKKYNYQKEAAEYYAELKKRQKRG